LVLPNSFEHLTIEAGDLHLEPLQLLDVARLSA
jgi:hypothetical protein